VEIVDYLRIARRRLWVLVGIPLAAAIVTTLFVFLSPAQYTATATVSAPALVGGSPGNQFSGSQAVGQFASAFQSTAQGPAIRQSVSALTGVPLAKISSGLQVAQVGASSTMQLIFTSTDRKQIVPVLTAVPKQTLSTLFGSQVTLAEQQITDTQADLTKADQAISSWEQANHVVDPPQIYQAMVDHLNTLQSQQSSLQANGKPSGSAALSAQIATTRASMTKFAPLLASYDVLAARRDAASASLTSAQQNLLTARSQLNASDPTKVAFISGEHTVNDGSQVLTKVLPVTGAAIFAAVALIAMLELLASGRLARSEERASQEEAQADESELAEPAEGAAGDQAPLEVLALDDAEVAVENDDDFLDEGEADDADLDDDIVAESESDEEDEFDEDEFDEGEGDDEDERSEKDSDSFAYLLK
jgi:hypothetical protein